MSVARSLARPPASLLGRTEILLIKLPLETISWSARLSMSWLGGRQAGRQAGSGLSIRLFVSRCAQTGHLIIISLLSCVPPSAGEASVSLPPRRSHVPLSLFIAGRAQLLPIIFMDLFIGSLAEASWETLPSAVVIYSGYKSTSTPRKG